MAGAVCHPKLEGRRENIAQERGTIVQKMSIGSIDEENPLYSVLGFQKRSVCTLCRRGKKGQMNSATYVDILDTLKKRIKQKQPGLLRARVIFHYNTTPHTSQMTEKKIEDLLWEVFMHPANSPDLTLSDCHLFPALKKFLGEKRIVNDENLKTTICQWMKDVGTQFYADGINKLVHRYEKCVQVGGDYMEKINIFLTCLHKFFAIFWGPGRAFWGCGNDFRYTPHRTGVTVSYVQKCVMVATLTLYCKFHLESSCFSTHRFRIIFNYF